MSSVHQYRGKKDMTDIESQRTNRTIQKTSGSSNYYTFNIREDEYVMSSIKYDI